MPTSKRGLALTELLISSAILLVLLGAGYRLLAQALSKGRLVEQITDRYTQCSALVELLGADLEKSAPEGVNAFETPKMLSIFAVLPNRKVSQRHWNTSPIVWSFESGELRRAESTSAPSSTTQTPSWDADRLQGAFRPGPWLIRRWPFVTDFAASVEGDSVRLTLKVKLLAADGGEREQTMKKTTTYRI